MGYVYYCAKTKVMAVLLILEGKTDVEVRAAIKDNPHHRTMDRWVGLYEETRRVIRDPATYAPQGRPRFFDEDEQQFIRELVARKPMLFLDEIREQIYDTLGVLPSLETIHLELTSRLEITCKKARTSNARKNFYRKALYQDLVRHIPAEMFVFTGKPFFFDSNFTTNFLTLSFPTPRRKRDLRARSYAGLWPFTIE